MPGAVLDSYALLAFLRGEDGSGGVRRLLDEASDHDVPLLMTEVNYAEVKYIVLRKEGSKRWAEVAAHLPALPLEFHAATHALADLAADFKARYAVSLADAFAVALAKERGAELVTGDPELRPLAKEVRLHWLR